MDTHNNKETAYTGMILNGFMMLAVIFILIPAIVITLLGTLPEDLRYIGIIVAAIALIAMAVMINGLFIQQPNQSRVMIFFGKYRGTFRGTGYFWVNPFMSRKKISLRIRNMDIAPDKGE